jgi:uncharacterized protein YyaL (SSP411 family)
VTIKLFKPIKYDPIPSLHASAPVLSNRLCYLTDANRARNYAEERLRYFGAIAEKYALHAATYFLAMHNHINYPPRVDVVEEGSNSKVHELFRTAWGIYSQHKIVIQIDPSSAEVTPLSWTIREMVAAKSSAPFVCAETPCAEPTDDPRILKETIKAFKVKCLHYS